MEYKRIESEYFVGCDLASGKDTTNVTVFKIHSYDVVGNPSFTEAKMEPVLTEREIRNRKREILKKKIHKVYGISS